MQLSQFQRSFRGIPDCSGGDFSRMAPIPGMMGNYPELQYRCIINIRHSPLPLFWISACCLPRSSDTCCYWFLEVASCKALFTINASLREHCSKESQPFEWSLGSLLISCHLCLPLVTGAASLPFETLLTCLTFSYSSLLVSTFFHT